MKRVFQRVVLWAVLVALMIMLVQTASAAAVPPRQTPLVLADGQWIVTFVTQGPISGDGFTGTISYDGAGKMIVTDGVVSGDWSMLGHSEYSGEAFTGSAELKFVGINRGNADMPILEQTGATGTGTATAGGRTTTGPVPLPATGLNAPITWDWMSCELATGYFTIPANAAVAAGGASSDLVAPLFATRDEAVYSGDMAMLSTDLTVLMIQAGDYIRAVETGGNFDTATLWDLLERSEALYQQLRLINGCDRAVAGEFINYLRSTLADLIDVMLAHPEAFTIDDLRAMINAAIRTGLIGAGAGDPGVAGEYELALREELRARIEEAGNCGDILMVVAAAHELGASDIVAEAMAGSGLLCEGG
jgi:hypothetical protein